jgi:phenylacetate-coenzyme A ligase PaaK-like adenylate-forming protein
VSKEVTKRVEYVISLAKQVPFYGKKAEEVGVDLDKIRAPDDLFEAYKRGFYTTSSDLPELVYYRDPNAKSFTTSGTKGKPKEVCLNPDDDKWISASWIRAIQSAIPKKCRVMVCLPEQPAISGHMVCITLEDARYEYMHWTAQRIGRDTAKFLEAFNEYNPNSLVGLTTFCYRLPKLLQNAGARSLKSLAFGGEPSSVERRSTIGTELNADPFDWYPSSENGMIAYEAQPLSNRYLVNLPHVLMYLDNKGKQARESEVGDVVLSNLLDPNLVFKPWMILLNYKIGDWATCLKKEGCMVTQISNIRREAAYLAGAKLEPAEIEKCIEQLEDYKGVLNGEYCVINYYDKDRKAVAEIRLECKGNLSNEDKREIDKKIRNFLYSFHAGVKLAVELDRDARLLTVIALPGELYKGYEQYVKPGKPRRLISLE